MAFFPFPKLFISTRIFSSFLSFISGHPVVDLHRYKYGKIVLGDLPPGEIREVPEESEEGQWARALINKGNSAGATTAAEPKGTDKTKKAQVKQEEESEG